MALSFLSLYISDMEQLYSCKHIFLSFFLGLSTFDMFSTTTTTTFSPVHAEAVVKGTNVDGVYDCHSQDNNATFEHISFRDLVSRGATTMDMMSLTFCEENCIPGWYSC